MKILIAAWHLKDRNVGLGRYCREIITAIGRVDKENFYEILMPDDCCHFPERPNIRYRLIRFPFFRRRFWEQFAPLLAGRYDVLHFPHDSCVALKRGRLVATVHDVKPLIFPGLGGHNLYSLVEQLLIRDRWMQIDHVLTVSQRSRSDIIERVGISGERVTVVYNGVDCERFRPANPCESLAAGERPYVLTVAGSDPTKNVEKLVEAFAQLPSSVRDTHDLVLAGDLRRRSDLRIYADRLGLAKQVRFTGLVSDQRLIELYQQAAVFVFPSRYEGFGMPVLEAMACGCPVISSNASSLPEVVGDAAILVDPADTEGLSDAISAVLCDGMLSEQLRAKGLHQAHRFSWDRAARETIGVYKNVSNRAS